MRIDHVVWDWNGTLFDDGAALVQATVDSFAVTGIAEVTWESYRAHFARPISAFYDSLAGRPLSPGEHRSLEEHFYRAYTARLDEVALHADAVAALAAWAETGRSQSLLSMYPHDLLTALTPVHSVAHHFTRIDGLHDDESHSKEPHLRKHLAAVGLDPANVLVVGDSADDMTAAAACGAVGLLYHPRQGQLLSHTRVRDLAVPVVAELPEVVRWALGGDRGA